MIDERGDDSGRLRPVPPDGSASQTERLLKITGAIAHAVSSAEVYEALIDHAADAIEASSAGLWLVDDAAQVARLAHSRGYTRQTLQSLANLPLSLSPSIPVLDAIRYAEPIWVASQAALLDRYPHLRPLVSAGRSYRIGCLPLITHGRVIGVLGFTVEQAQERRDMDRDFLLIVAGYATQAVERLRLLEAERHSRQGAERLYGFAQTVVVANRIESVFDAAADAIEAALGATRSAILTFEDDGPMRFRAWRNLSDRYRQAVEGHSPWSRDAVAPEPVLVEDVERDLSMRSFLPLFRGEGISALAFIPLVSSGRLIGKFMVYYDAIHPFVPREVEAARAIANQLATVINRFSAVAKLEETIRYNELFTAVLAHDLRNPLSAMMMAAQLVLQQGAADDRTVKSVARIVSSGGRMTRMIDQLLDFTRARLGGGMQLQRQHLDLQKLAKLTVDELELTAPDRTFVVETEGDLGGDWDGDRMARVFSNLVGNAVQHGSGEAPVLLQLDGRSPHWVEIQISNAGAIPPDMVGRLFEPFRNTQHKRDGSQGLGLGLYITQQIIRAHGGEVAVTSTATDGTRFRLRLPRVAASALADAGAQVGEATKPPSPAAPAQLQAPETSSASQKAVQPVLLVDDDVDIREALSDLLVDRGFSVMTAANGAEAIALLESLTTPPFTILLDIMMPVMDGYGFLEVQRQDVRLSRIPVMVITAGHGVDYQRLGESMTVLPKPLNVTKLVATLHQLRDGNPS